MTFSVHSSWTSLAWIRCTKARLRWQVTSSTWRALMVSQALSPATWMLGLLEPPQATRCSVPWRGLWMEACPFHTGNFYIHKKTKHTRVWGVLRGISHFGAGQQKCFSRSCCKKRSSNLVLKIFILLRNCLRHGLTSCNILYGCHKE